MCGWTSDLLHHDIVVGEDTDLSGDLDGVASDLGCAEVGVSQHGACGGECVGATAADGMDTFVGFEDIAVSADEVDAFVIGDKEEGFESSEIFVGAPFFSEFDGGAGEVSVKVFESAFEFFLEGEGVSGGASKTADDFVVVDTSDFASGVLDDGVLEGDLAVARDGGLAVFFDGNDGRSMKHNDAS